jgi:hypothetical protein
MATSLSMIEAAMRISNNTIPIEIIEKIVQYGKNCSKNQLFYCQALKNLSRFAREIQTRCSHRGSIRPTKKNSTILV